MLGSALSTHAKACCKTSRPIFFISSIACVALRAHHSIARSERPFVSSSMTTARDNVVTLMSRLPMGGHSIVVFARVAKCEPGHCPSFERAALQRRKPVTKPVAWQSFHRSEPSTAFSRVPSQFSESRIDNVVIQI
jgi:hypothetical protein